MKKGTLIEKTTYDLGLVMAANLPTSRIPIKVQEYFLQHKELIPTVLKKGFLMTLPADFLDGKHGFSLSDWEKLLQIEEKESISSSPLRLISSGQNIVIRATNGKRTIAQAKDVFTWGIDPNFKKWGLDIFGKAKPKTPVEVHEMTEGANFKTIFNSLSRNLNDLCFEQEQIIAFVEDHKDWLRKDGYETFFLFKKANEVFVADVGLDADERPDAGVNRFSRDFVWVGDFCHCVVVPQQTLVD